MSEPNPNYDDVEDMLFKGFLTLPSRINGVSVVFKTINEKEHELANMMVVGEDETAQQERLCYFLAYSVFVFNGVNILPYREEWVHSLVQLFSDLPFSFCLYLISLLSDLNARAKACVSDVEPYSFGVESRHNWQAYGSHLLSDRSITAIPGTENLGMNNHQKLWIFYNTREDVKQEYDRDYSLAKFMVSPHANKSVKRMNSKDQAKQRREAKKRRDMYLTKDGDVVTTEEGQIRIEQRSVEELVAEMKKDLSGEKDFHDQVVEAHQKKVKAMHDQKLEERQQRRAQARAKNNEVFDGVGSKRSFAVYDEEQVEQITKKKQERKSELLKEGAYQDNFHERQEYIDKWFSEDDQRSEPETSASHSDNPRPQSSFEGTLLGEYHKAAKEDLNRPNELDFPDLINDD